MEYIAAILFALVVVYQLVRRRPKALVPPTAPALPAPKADPGGTPGTAEQGSLALRLRPLEAAFAPFGANAAHPRELAELAEFEEAVGLLADAGVPLDTVLQYAQGANWALSCAALAALPKRADAGLAVDRIIAHFEKLAPWAMHFALDYFVRVTPRPPVGAPVVSARDWWRDNPMLGLMFQDYFARRAALADPAEFGPALYTPSASPPAPIRSFLERVGHPLATALLATLDRIQRSNVDRGFLTTFGRFWTGEHHLLMVPDAWREPLDTAEARFRQSQPRSLLVSGEPLVGKTSFLRLLSRRLGDHGYSVFEAGGADLMAGQQWFGQLEGRIQRAVQELTVEKRLIWYIPDLMQVARSGTHQGQSASILDQVLPAINSGRLVVWTEATASATARLMQMRPALRGILDVVRLDPQSEAATRALARDLARQLTDETTVTIDPQSADAAVDAARQYLGAGSFPGSALQLIRLTADRTDAGGSIAAHDVIETLSRLTGLPVSILDNQERIDLDSIRGFFAGRVIGQDEAVASVVERIAMLKAGLNDPARPIGVFLFAGPTGTGKTELAKTTAEYLFGSVDRLIRLDMSEFQTADSINNVLGGGHAESESLINLVRKQPFSVVLLDEFEKAHPRIWDLFLQVFDDARLTDTLGQVADFRHCLIIMTSNLGATSHKTSGLGFAPAADVFTADQVMNAIRQTYRPEFQNRLDKVIVFRPLTRDLMRVILRKELARVLERRGLKDRAWAVEWEASALEFLLEKGFSPEMGARPLKRAIDQYVIAPLAATIVERRFPEGEQFVFFRSDGRVIQAEFVDPDADHSGAAAPPEVEAGGAEPPALATMILAPAGTTAEFDALAGEIAEVERSLASPGWSDLKRRLSDAMTVPEFWTRPERLQTLARLALMDRVAAAAGTADALRARLARGARRPDRYSRELVSRLALQLHLVKAGIEDVRDDAPIEAALLVEPAFEAAAAADRSAIAAWCVRLLDMYRGWANNRHMQLSEIDGGPADLAMLLVAGFGAHRVLSRECGLHVLELADPGDGSSRATARVRLAVPPLAELPAAKLRRELVAAFDKTPRPTAVVRRYRGEPAPLVRNADGTWRTGKLDAVLRGDFDLLAAG